MKFTHGTRRRAAEYEKDWVRRWKDDQTFEKSVAQRPVDNAYVFYDGPPFITGVPHHGTLLSSIVKDAVPRYWTMKGKRVERRWGWDCHGLPAENFVEKQMNIVDRRQIVTNSDQPAPLDKDGNPLPTISLEKYITKARESMVANSETWQGVIDRIGRWVDFEGAYRTMDKDFMESVWWAFKQLYEAGKIYEGEKVLMYDTKFATPVSKAEVTMDNDAYQTVTDPSVYVKFKLKDSKASRKIVLNEHSKVLFVCNANAARSQMAQGFYNHYSHSQNADSAGLNPEKKWDEAPTLSDFEAMSHKPAKSSETMQEVGIDITGHKRQLLTVDKLGDYDLIVNLAEKSQTPDWLRGDNVIWWNVTDPRNESVEKNRIARDEIEQRVKQLLNGEIVDDTQKPAGFDECERSHVGALLVDTNGKLIAQQREDKPGITNPGMVSLFGGTSHEGESPIETLRRELQEELELEVNSSNLLLQTIKHENGTNVACSIYIVTGVDAEKLKLYEGAGFAVGTPEDLLSRSVTGVTQQAIEAFMAQRDDISQYNYVILHGYTGRNDKNFIPWLKHELEQRGAKVQAPQLPNTDNPTEVEQVQYVLDHVQFDENTVLIGHSLGGLVAMRMLEKLPHKIHHLMLVAPTVLPQFYDKDYEIDAATGERKRFIDHFSYDFDFDKISSQAVHKTILQDNNDSESRKPSMRYIAENIGATLCKTVANKRHFVAEQEPFILEKLLANEDSDNAFLLAWTTTPWTLPANLMLAVNPDMTYCEVKVSKGTKNVFLISGKHAYASREYYPQLKQQLEQQGYTVTIIDHINPDSPDLAENVEQLAQYDFTHAHVVTHSLGAATFLKYLQDANMTVASLTMIAPACGVSNSSDEQWKQESGYVGLAVDLTQVRRKIAQRPTIIYSDDADVLKQGFAQLGKELGAATQYEPGKGHFFTAEKSLVPEITLPLSEKLILAEEALERTLQDEKHQPLDYKVLRTFPGSELVGKKYQPLDTGSTWPGSDKIHTIYAADFVSHESGTGIVHIAPAYGEDDFELAKRHGISAFHVIDDNGYYTDGNYKGLEVWDNNKFIAKDLKEKGAVWKIEYIRHEYPFNPRSKQRIMYRAIPSWFFDIQGQKPLMLEQNEHINWFPRHLKHGRFAKNIEQAPDWNLSRDRFWATAMPVWKGDRGTVRVVGSYAELKEMSGVELDDYHRPWVDDITFTIDGETFTRIDKVLDCWFESGSMPFAQLHYPFENQAKFEQNYPADFIVEYIGQVRAWFYYVHAVNVALAEIGAFGEAGAQHKNAYSNVITTGVVAGNDGRKMSKSLGNFTDPNELMDKFSADSLRFLLLSSPLLNGEDFALHDKDVGDVARKLAMIWNMYDFFTMYAEVDEFTFPYDTASSDAFLVHRITNTAHSDTPESLSRPGTENSFQISVDITKLTNPLDIWIISRLHELVAEVEKQMDAYNIPDALSPILPFLDDASNWYVRRSRRRFWKSEDDGDKNDAYRTLHYVLVRLSYILAPFTPFLAEELYHNLTGDDESIHLKNWLPAGAVNEQVLADMARTRELINNGLSLRMKKDEHQASIKVRQPLQCAAYAGAKLAEYYEQIMAEELNVKEIRWVENLDEHLADYDVTEGVIKPENWIEISKHVTPELKREGLMREVIRYVQSARKKAGLQVDDRIVLHLAVGAEPTSASQSAASNQAQPASDAAAQLGQALAEHADTIASETLATMKQPDDVLYQTTAMVDGAELQISLAKA